MVTDGNHNWQEISKVKLEVDINKQIDILYSFITTSILLIIFMNLKS
jgi:hypothetical protein